MAEEKKDQKKTGEACGSGETGETPASPETPDSSETPVPPDPQVPPVQPEKSPDKSAEPDWKDLYARLLADFDNYKKRAAREREDTYRYAESDILKDVLPTVDNLQLALDNAKDRADDEFVKGVKLVYDSLVSALKDHGAEPFDSVGKALDTECMEAIATLPSEDVAEGLVSIESKRGWKLKDKVLRAAQVVVSAGKAQGS